MGNRENRVFNKVGHRVPRALLVLFAGLLPLLLLCDSFATGCDSSMAFEPALFETRLDVRGREPVKRPLPISATSDIMVFARESGIDITLEITDAAGHVVGRGDSPLRRSGIQRVELTTRPGQHYYIVVTGKEQPDAAGSVDIRVVDLQRTVNSSCQSAQKLLAGADKAYAAGQAVTSAESDASGISSDKAYANAATGYRAAASALSISGASPLLARAQHAEAAVLYLNVQNWDAARSWAADAARTYETIGDEYGNARATALEAAALLEISMSAKTDSDTTDSPQRARQMLQKARAMLNAVSEFHARRHELYDQAAALNNIGYAYYYEGRYDEAIRTYQQSLPIYEQLHERLRNAQVLQNIALVEYELGRLSVAIPRYQESLDLINREQNPQGFAFVLGNSALANWANGNEDTALRQYGESLTLAQTVQDAYEQAVALHGIASVYNTVGDHTRALAYYRQALALRSTTLDPRGRTASLRAIGNLLRQEGHADEALKMHREALSLASAPSTRARIVVQIAKDLDDLGKSEEAAKELDVVLTQRAAGDDVEHARALEERAKHRAAAGNFAGAETDFKSALETFQTYETPTDEFDAWIGLARLMRRRGATDAAFDAVDHALALAEEVRLQSANPELRSTLLQPLRPAFDLKISMLAEQYAAATDGRTQESIALRALATAEQARSRALADFQNLDVTTPGLDPRLLERRRTIYREIAARRFRLETSLDRSGTTDTQSQAIRTEIATLRQSLDQIDAQIGAASENARVPRPTDQQTVLAPANIPTDVALIEYWLGSDDAFAWVVTRGNITMTRLGASSRINSDAMALHTALRGFGAVPKSDRLDAGEKLYDRVLAPIAARLSASHTLIFAPDGALHYVPFATLRSNEGGHRAFLVESHDVAVTPSIDMLMRLEKTPRAGPPASGRQMLLVADPVYERRDPRFAGPSTGLPDTRTNKESVALVRGISDSGQLPRLPGAAREAAAIAALLSPDSVEELDGFAANRETFLGTALGSYRFIHVASHATTDAEIPQASALILSTVDKLGKEIDGRVLAADFMSFRLQADVVVLSACDTALGKSVAGEGLVGLRYVVLARGARSVVSSLWPATDQVTADLMVRFYSTLLHERAPVISAWSAANRAMLGGRYSDPATWGAFTLTLSHIGDVAPP